MSYLYTAWKEAERLVDWFWMCFDVNADYSVVLSSIVSIRRGMDSKIKFIDTLYTSLQVITAQPLIYALYSSPLQIH
jgi:hypothetical protein